MMAATLTLGAYLHTLDPVLFRLGDRGPAIRWYGLSYLLGFFLAYLIVRWFARTGRSPLRPAAVADFILAAALGAVLGGRLGYVFFYQPELLGPIDHFPYWGVLAMNEGGMASHGGMIGVLVAVGLFARRRQLSWGHLMDLVAFAAPLGLFFGRIANFINGELYGRACAATYPLAVQFPNELVELSPAKWRQFVELADQASVGLTALEAMERIRHGDALLQWAARQVLTPRHPSQLYEAVAEGLVLWGVLAVVWLKPRKPWVVGAWFLMAYAVLRIGCEFFREPDAGIKHAEFAHWGISRGQLLSLGIFVAGAAVWFFARRASTAPLGGLRHRVPLQ